MTYRYTCACHGGVTATVDTARRHVHVTAAGRLPSECVLPRLAHLCCSDDPGGADRPDLPVQRAAAMAATRPGTRPRCQVVRL